MSKLALLKKIETVKRRINKERDALRELIEDAEAVDESCGEAIDALEAASDALSKRL